MENLAALYQRLTTAGMPEVRGLSHAQCEGKAVWTVVGEQGDSITVFESMAEKIIESHAIRWWQGVEKDREVRVFWYSRDDHIGLHVEKDPADTREPRLCMSLLEAVVAAAESRAGQR